MQGSVAASASPDILSALGAARCPSPTGLTSRCAGPSSTATEDGPPNGIPLWLDFQAHSRRDALCIPAGGVVAFYLPTKIKYHRPKAAGSKRTPRLLPPWWRAAVTSRMPWWLEPIRTLLTKTSKPAPSIRLDLLDADGRTRLTCDNARKKKIGDLRASYPQLSNS